MQELKARLRDRFPDALMSGEAWYDGLGAITPIIMSWAEAAWPEFADHLRTWGHIAYLTDPANGSTGVHEAGFREYEPPKP